MSSPFAIIESLAFGQLESLADDFLKFATASPNTGKLGARSTNPQHLVKPQDAMLQYRVRHVLGHQVCGDLVPSF